MILCITICFKHILLFSTTLPNMPHVYYMYDTRVIDMWCFMCITQEIPTPLIHVPTPVIHMFYTYKTDVYPTHVLHV